MKSIMSECPVEHGKKTGAGSECPIDGDDRKSGLMKWLQSYQAKSGQAARSSSASSSPEQGNVDNSQTDGSARNGYGYNALANDEHFGQERQAGQKVQLSQQRTLSGIPKGEYTPAHQSIPGESNTADGSSKSTKWIYPSEQQYFNAMKRKGYNPKEQEVSSILAIHNVVNERSWSEILKWEAFRGNLDPTLMRFIGKPKELSPKAKFLTYLGRPPPFDRHDWFVDRDGKEVRYVVDFYEVNSRGSKGGMGGIPIHIDVRPALDSTGALVDRLELAFRHFWKLQVPQVGRR